MGWLAKYYSPLSSRRKTKWLPILNKVTLKQVKSLFGPLGIQLLWYILCGLVNIHHYSPPLEWIIVNYWSIWFCVQTSVSTFLRSRSTYNKVTVLKLSLSLCHSEVKSWVFWVYLIVMKCFWVAEYPTSNTRKCCIVAGKIHLYCDNITINENY